MSDYLQHRKDRDDLRACIEQEIKTHGVHCSLNHLDISHIRNMDGLFEELSFEGDISKWDVSKVRSMARMFKICRFNGDISNWDTSSVVTTDTMFSFSKFNGDISKWDMRRVIDATSMFYESSFNQDISNWEMPSLIRASSMFMRSQVTGDLSKWKMDGVANLSYMFKDSQFNRDLSSWTINPIASTEEMFCRSPFQGAFPYIDLSESGRGVMLDDGYRGVFPANYTLRDLCMVFGGSHPIERYLRDTVASAFQRVHVEQALSEGHIPDWMPKPLLDWFDDQKSLCLGLGLNAQQATDLVYGQYPTQRSAPQVLAEVSSFDFGSLAEAPAL